jgi:hypothetical protein
MTRRVQFWSLARHAILLTGVLAAVQLPSARAQDKVKPPEWKHGMDVKARKASEDKFDAKTQKYGIEVFVDPNTGKLAYITEGGNLAVLSGTAGGDKSEEPEWRHGLRLRVRKAGEADFSDKTKEYGVEVYRDKNSNNLVYITETGSVAVVPGGNEPAPKEVKKPDWRHGLEMPVRKAGEAEFTEKTTRYGMEVFVDANNGNVVYINETGAIAVVPGAGLPARPDKVKSPEWKHAMELKVRDAGANDFNDKTPKIGIEVYYDPNADKSVVISQTGAISVLNGKTADGKNKNPDWKHGLEMAARKAGQKEFDKNTPKFGIEVYSDEITNALIYIVQTGAVSAVPLK